MACGVWQAWTLIDRAQDLAQDAVTAHEAPAAASSAARESVAAPAVSPSSSPPPASQVHAATRPGRDDGAAVKTAPLLSASGNLSRREAATRAFEALAEASESVIPVGLAPLDEAADSLTLGRPPPATYPHSDCEDIFVYIVTLAEGAPLQSSASLGIGKQGPARFRRPGQSVGDWTVLAISDDWTGLNPQVWLERDGLACRAELAGNPSRIHQAPKPAPRPKAKARRRRPRRR